MLSMLILSLLFGGSFLAVGIVASYGVSLSAGGVSIQRTINRSGDGAIGKEISVPAAKALSAWVKTDANTAAGNLASDHGWTTGTYDVYWAGGARYDVPVTISTNACALDGGTGDDFPDSANTTVVLAKRTPFNITIDGDLLHILGMSLEFSADVSSAGRVLFEDAAGDDIASIEMTGNAPLVWDIDGGAVNPFAGDVIATGKVSHANTTSAATLKITGIDDSTP